ncbi:MAG: ABC transporter ATP-binding protein [Acidobacteria bacterium]|jgi:subfamily B ATP-binding cassette protein MsbA|nr:ABC transporter ATP-binding protein [Acidobacteriota bacterium]
MADEDKKKKKVNYASAWQEAKVLIWNYRWRLALGGVLMILSRLAGLVLPASSKYLIDEVITKQHFEMLKWIALAVGISTLIQALTSFALTQILGIAAQRAITEMRKRVQTQIEKLPISFFDSTQSGQLISRIMNDAEGIRNLVGTGLVQLVGSVITAGISVCVLFYINWRLTSVTLLVLAAFGGVLAYAFKKLRPIFRERNVINAEVTGRLGESLGGIRIVKAYTAEKREELTFARGAHKLLRNVAKSMTGVSAITAFSSLIIGAISVVMIIIGGNSVMSGTMTIGDLFMYIFFTGLMAFPIVELTSIGTQITDALAGLDRIREVLGKTTEDDEDEARQPLPDIKGGITFEDVYFEYEANTPVLRGISFDSPAGTTTALVGSSGSGKSTILSLVLNFIQPSKGRILVDGKDLQTIKLRDYRRYLGVVLQDDFLFDGTILENVRFSNPQASFAEIKEVCRIAYCDEFIEKFEKGYETIVGERGVKLSGGQRQRLAIARALLADPKILILDEATSSLDSESEQMIQEGLNTLRKGRTTFVIAHRLSTIRSADNILVVEAGEIVESGMHDELLVLNGRYRQLYDKQYKLEKNLFINPGEDFTPDAPKVEKEKIVSTSLPHL